jgi:hypothetical protein
MAKPRKPEYSAPLAGTVYVDGPPFWIVDGESYDFSEWMKVHPGGAVWLRLTQRRDISVLFHVMHRDPARLRKLLDKYRIPGKTRADILPGMGVPPFLVPPGFNAARDLPSHDFDDDLTLLKQLRRRLGSVLPPRVLRRYDIAFDLTTAAIFAVHTAIIAGLVFGWLPAWAFVCAMFVTRTALAGAGHYYIHRKWRDHGKVMFEVSKGLFDINYVGTCLIAADGHVLLHHPHVGSGADVKRTFFDGMLQLHPLLRMFGYTVHKLGVCLLGAMIRGVEVFLVDRDKGIFRGEFWLMRLWMTAEFAACLWSGHLLAWLVQFVIVLWFNTFLVVASHDFEDARAATQLALLPEHLRDDWAARQIALSYDLSVVGIRWVDVFLSAGLSPHRVHHVFPTQRSGFANIASEAAVRAVCEAQGVRWERPRNLFIERLPALMRHYLLAPAKRRPPPGMPPRSGAVHEVVQWLRYSLGGWVGVGI